METLNKITLYTLRVVGGAEGFQVTWLVPWRSANTSSRTEADLVQDTQGQGWVKDVDWWWWRSGPCVALMAPLPEEGQEVWCDWGGDQRWTSASAAPCGSSPKGFWDFSIPPAVLSFLFFPLRRWSLGPSSLLALLHVRGREPAHLRRGKNRG